MHEIVVVETIEQVGLGKRDVLDLTKGGGESLNSTTSPSLFVLR